MYLPIIALMLYYSNARLEMSILTIALTFVGGMIFWSLFEYLIHRFAFHYFAESEKAKKIVYIIHGNPHEYPRDKERLFMPPVRALFWHRQYFALIWLVSGLFGASNYAFAFFPGFMLGYLIYGSMHYAIHAWTRPFK